jgi:GLPGLI family protein
MRIIYIMISCCLWGVGLHAQQRFPTSGTITFEKSVNVYAIINAKVKQNQNNTFYKQYLESYKGATAQFKRLNANLVFSGDKTLFSPVPDDNASDMIMSMFQVVQPNIVYTDLGTGRYTCQKEVYGDKFLVSDSVRYIKWKITNETREIAGYQCRRANAVIMDSVYVVAFYTDQIHVSGGPESFTGLPGMILGVALPHDNVTWFATKVDLTGVGAGAMVVPKKGRAVDVKGLGKKLDEVFKGYTWEDPRQWLML